MESTGLESVGNRRVVSQGAGMCQIRPHYRVTSKGKHLGMTVTTPGHRDIGRAAKGVQDLVLFVLGRCSGGFNGTMAFEDEVVGTQLREEERNGGLEDVVIQIASNNNLVSCSQPCLNFST